MARILFIDDDDAGRQMAVYNLRRAGHRVDEATDGQRGLEAFRPDAHELVITDVRMPTTSGIDVVAAIRRQPPGARNEHVPVIVITAYGNIETAVEAMRAGAYDFIAKPFGRDQLLITVDKALQHRQLALENATLRRQLAGIERPIVAGSDAMRAVLRVADRVARSAAAALLTGASGTGKELLARRLHARSARADRPFVVVNCAAIAANLVEAELFGHTKGAFTGATHARPGRLRQADGGTLFLDEIAELPLAAQGKLLRVLQEGVLDVVGADAPAHVDVRVVAATNSDLHAAVAAGRFREDLYYRLNVIEITVPALAQRRADIKPLAEHFVRELSEGRELRMPPAFVDELLARPWPGNVRQLRNACQRAVVLCAGDDLSVADLPPRAPPAARNHGGGGQEAHDAAGALLSLPEGGLSLLDLEKAVIERVLERCGGNVSEAARYLRVPRHILAYRLQKYGIERRSET